MSTYADQAAAAAAAALPGAGGPAAPRHRAGLAGARETGISQVN